MEHGPASDWGADQAVAYKKKPYHYDISLPEECTYRLTGFINSNMTLTILPDVADSGQVKFSEQDKADYIEQYIGLAGKNIEEVNEI